MSKWEVVTAAACALEEYKHKQRREARRAHWFTEDNLRLLLLAINIVRVLYK